MTELYAGSDLHGNNNLLGIIDGQGKRIYEKRLSNDSQLVREVLKPYKEEIIGVVVKSTYNGYWMMDALMEQGYKVHLANPSAI
jgi:transposase